jgi:glucuronate isomerase
MSAIYLPEDRYFEPSNRDVALHLYGQVKDLPLVCPHGHVDPRLFSDPNYQFGTPTELFIIPDHYIFRMLYAQGMALEDLGVLRVDGGPVEPDHRKIWQVFAENFYLFRGTPTGIWLNYSFQNVFGITEKLDGNSAQAIYDQIAAQLTKPEFRPRALFEQFNIEVLTTTDAATDPLQHHLAMKASGWKGRVLPTFRPDAVVNLDTVGWLNHIRALGERVGSEISGYKAFVEALENRRSFFKSLGATATDHAAVSPYTAELSDQDADAIFQRALKGQASADDAARFTGHMLMQMARMSVDDGLVMQLHVGSYRNHNRVLFDKFGPDKGADIPVQTEYTRNMHPLLNKYGTDPRFSMILFTLDETAYGREMAPLAGHYPALKLGPPWWFFDSLNGMNYYFDKVMETAGVYNTAGFNDDTRAFTSIPARHDVWRRAAANWIAGQHVRGIIDMEDAEAMIYDMSYGLVKKAYKFA